MLLSGPFLLSIINAAGIFALILLSYGKVLRLSSVGLLQQVFTGLLFGAGACLAIADTVRCGPSLVVDLRGVILILAGPFGGPVCALVAAVVASGARAFLGGAAMWPGICAICTTALIGVLFAQIVFPTVRPAKAKELLTLGVLANLPLLFILAAPVPDAVSVFMKIVGPMSFFNTIGVFIFGRTLCGERRAFFYGRQLETDAVSDPLTGLANRRGLQRRIQPIFDSACQTRQPVSVLLIDIDHLKLVNERSGHAAGDSALKSIAAIVSRNLRSCDAVARYGGEKIVVVLPDTSLTDGSSVAERIRLQVENEAEARSQETLTVSIGVASMRGVKISFDRLFGVADLALYDAKAKGRNRVECASALDMSVPAAAALSPAM